MSVRSISQYKLMLDNVGADTAACWLLSELRGYRLYGDGQYRRADIERISNFLLAWTLVYRPIKQESGLPRL